MRIISNMDSASNIAQHVRNSSMATASCDPQTGKMSWKWNPIVERLSSKAIKCGIKECFRVHEEEHIKTNSSCCERLGKCWKNAGLGAEDDCVNAWIDWMRDPGQEAFDEFLSYTAQLHCMEKKMEEAVFTNDSDCCFHDLMESADWVESWVRKHDANAKPLRCPFNEDGSIVPSRGF